MNTTQERTLSKKARWQKRKRKAAATLAVLLSVALVLSGTYAWINLGDEAQGEALGPVVNR
jgi:accessory gene regulator protein AgrB